MIYIHMHRLAPPVQVSSPETCHGSTISRELGHCTVSDQEDTDFSSQSTRPIPLEMLTCDVSRLQKSFPCYKVSTCVATTAVKEQGVIIFESQNFLIVMVDGILVRSSRSSKFGVSVVPRYESTYVVVM